jgi:chitin disaccharide deacetylase
MMERFLIVNADDLGMHPAVDAGILEAHERGIVTSTSLMVRRASAADAASKAWSVGLAIGLHLDLSEWEYGDGRWQPRYERADPRDESAVAQELRDQLERFRELVGADPTHLDSHQHVHGSPPVLGIARRMAAELRVPLRNDSAAIAYRGDFYGQTGTGEPYPEGITREAMTALLRGLPPGITEVGCHPGHALDPDVSSYAAERSIELRTLCDPDVRTVIAEEAIRLISFADVRGSA